MNAVRSKQWAFFLVLWIRKEQAKIRKLMDDRMVLLSDK